jgi:hypothetical protein
MYNRYRVEIYDENKLNDLTLYFADGVNREHLSELVFSNIRRFQGKVRAHVFDKKKKAKVLAIFYPEEIVKKYNNNKLTKEEIGLV